MFRRGVLCCTAKFIAGWDNIMAQAGSVSSGEQNRALALSTIAFTANFAVWTIFSIIGVAIKKELSLTEAEFGLLIATPVLTGSVIRLILGVWTERYGGRLVFTLQMLAASLATFALTFAHTYPGYLLAALGVGLAGGSFIVGVAYVSRWYEPGKQGTALGIFGAGNVGAAVTKFVAPFVHGGAGLAAAWRKSGPQRLPSWPSSSTSPPRTSRSWLSAVPRALPRQVWPSSSRR
jgi:NNP family nitrate/nitrite transporter-like MFS transporter